ncbi:MAG: DUF3822 family protein [Ginsengibacter sp.]
MNTVFEILPSTYEPENCSLICEVSNEGFSYCIKEEEAQSFLGLAVYHFDSTKPAVGFPISLQVLFHQKEIFSKRFKKVCVIFSFPQSVLIPLSMYHHEKNQTVMNMMFGDVDTNDIILSDVISDQSLYNSYRISAATLEMVKNQFPNASIAHQYSLILKKPLHGKDRLTVIFYTQKVVVHLVKEGKHQLMNSYSFTAEKDISYLLLNICKQFQIRNVHLVLCGLIEENSALYKEIYKYFDDIELPAFREGYQYSEGITSFPSHYFSHIFDADSCE